MGSDVGVRNIDSAQPWMKDHSRLKSYRRERLYDIDKSGNLFEGRKGLV